MNFVAGLDDTATAVQLYEWMNEYFKLCFKFPCAADVMHLLLIVFSFEIYCDNAKLSSRLCRFFIVLQYRYLLILPFVYWFHSMKAKVFGMWQYTHKTYHDIACFLRQTRAIKSTSTSTSNSKIEIVVETVATSNIPWLQSHSFIVLFMNLSISWTVFMYLVWRPWHFW